MSQEDIYNHQQRQQESEAGAMDEEAQMDTDASVDYKICGELRK